MTPSSLLTADDLDAIGSAAFDADDPLAIAAELVEAVEQNRLADKADTAYALTLAAEITERHDSLEAAQVLAARAARASRSWADPDVYPRAYNAQLLLQLGREDEGMAEFTAIRPLMTEDPSAALAIGEALEEAGHAALAVDWLTEAVDSMLQLMRSDEPDPDGGEPVAMLAGLVQQRHRLRQALDLPHDRYDDLAARLSNAMEQESAAGGAAMLFWPSGEFDRAVDRWPALAQEYGHDWDEHRAGIELALRRLSDDGHAALSVLTASVDGLAALAMRTGGDPTDPETLEEYAAALDSADETPWPPGRNDRCWCGSGVKYKKCCLPRSRA